MSVRPLEQIDPPKSLHQDIANELLRRQADERIHTARMTATPADIVVHFGIAGRGGYVVDDGPFTSVSAFQGEVEQLERWFHHRVRQHLQELPTDRSEVVVQYSQGYGSQVHFKTDDIEGITVTVEFTD